MVRGVRERRACRALLRLARLPLCFMLLAVSVHGVRAQDTPSLAERLGYEAGDRLLIVHADDLGAAHAVNAASIAALETGLVNSASIMVPCPWFPEIAAYARAHPEHDLGLHLTLTSEWAHYRWQAVTPRTEVPSLHDEQGYLHATTAAAVEHIDSAEAEVEIRAQVERALAFGVRPTHLDSHMGVLFQTPALFDAYLRVGREYGLPVMVPREGLEQPEGAPLRALLRPGDVLVDRLAMATPQVPAEAWGEYYSSVIEGLKPGVTELIIHLGYDDAEMQAVAVDHPDFGAAWRQRDFDFFTSDAFRDLLEAHGVHLVTWRQLQRLAYPDGR